MDIDNYLHHYKIFDAEFNANATLEDRLDKCHEECFELIVAIENYKKCKSTSYMFPIIRKNLISELTDTMNTSIAALIATHHRDPLHLGYEKLQRTTEKYRQTEKNNGFVLEGGEGDESGIASDSAAD